MAFYLNDFKQHLTTLAEKSKREGVADYTEPIRPWQNDVSITESYRGMHGKSLLNEQRRRRPIIQGMNPLRPGPPDMNLQRQPDSTDVSNVQGATRKDLRRTGGPMYPPNYTSVSNVQGMTRKPPVTAGPLYGPRTPPRTDSTLKLRGPNKPGIRRDYLKPTPVDRYTNIPTQWDPANPQGSGIPKPPGPPNTGINPIPKQTRFPNIPTQWDPANPQGSGIPKPSLASINIDRRRMPKRIMGGGLRPPENPVTPRPS